MYTMLREMAADEMFINGLSSFFSKRQPHEWKGHTLDSKIIWSHIRWIKQKMSVQNSYSKK